MTDGHFEVAARQLADRHVIDTGSQDQGKRFVYIKSGCCGICSCVRMCACVFKTFNTLSGRKLAARRWTAHEVHQLFLALTLLFALFFYFFIFSLFFVHVSRRVYK